MKFWSYSLFFSIFLLSGCATYDEIHGRSDKSYFRPPQSSIVFQNEETGEIIDLSYGAVTCHFEPYFDSYRSSSYYWRIYPELCAQQAIRSESSKCFLDFSLSSRNYITDNDFDFFFPNGHFHMEYDNYESHDIQKSYDSLQIAGTMHYKVYVIKNRGEFVNELHADTAYLEQSVGLVKIVDSNNQNWIVR
jgi:hypothetical protein